MESITQWWTTFCTFFKRDDCYSSLIRDSAAWNSSEANYGQAVETVGMSKSAANMKEDLLDLLHTWHDISLMPTLLTR